MRVFDRRRFWLTLGAAAGAAAVFASILLRTLDRSERISFFGTAFGAAVAALTALGVVEYTAHAEQRRSRGILLGMLDRIEKSIRDLPPRDRNMDWGVERRERAEIARMAIAPTLGVAEDLRAKLPGAAAVLLHLQGLDDLVGSLVDKGRLTEGQFAELQEGTRDTTRVCRKLLG